jgi:hypothetical protein
MHVLVTEHCDRHWLSVPQTWPVWHSTVALQVLSVVSWQTPVLPDDTHRSSAGQSRDSVQALWHRPNAHAKGELQSLLIEQAWASAAAFELPQLETVRLMSAAMAKPKRRAVPGRRCMEL